MIYAFIWQGKDTKMTVPTIHYALELILEHDRNDGMGHEAPRQKTSTSANDSNASTINKESSGAQILPTSGEVVVRKESSKELLRTTQCLLVVNSKGSRAA